MPSTGCAARPCGAPVRRNAEQPTADELAAELKVSAAVGAFLVGIALSGPVAHHATQILNELRLERRDVLQPRVVDSLRGKVFVDVAERLEPSADEGHDRPLGVSPRVLEHLGRRLQPEARRR